jgi:hypothetical protein
MHVLRVLLFLCRSGLKRRLLTGQITIYLEQGLESEC